jgi:hypothetical protein
MVDVVVYGSLEDSLDRNILMNVSINSDNLLIIHSSKYNNVDMVTIFKRFTYPIDIKKPFEDVYFSKTFQKEKKFYFHYENLNQSILEFSDYVVKKYGLKVLVTFK